MPWRAGGDGVRSDEEVRQLYLDNYGTRRTDVDERMRNREPIEIPFGDGLLTLTWEPGPDDTLS
jgi:hypothetical protein